MCGVAGIINLNQEKVDPINIEKMMIAMKHRGPDDEGVFIQDNIGLGFVRLSILDLSHSGHQPMHSIDERYVIVFNGEVYNYLELRNELSNTYTFKSETDTEVVLYSYIEWGEECLHRFNGMFAFVIFDTILKKTFGARDRFGIKPLYYYQNNNQFVFASDIPPILKGTDYKPSANDSIIFNYLLTNRTNYSEETFFDGIKKIQPGHHFYIENNKVVINQWYNFDNYKSSPAFTDSEDYYNSLKKAIKLQLRSDVPIGVCLSGGLDSSAITSILLEDFKINNLHSYTAIYNKGETGDEQDFIDVFKNKNIQMHYTKPNASSLLNDLSNYIEALSEPVPGTSEYAEFKVMELAKNHSTVLLNGQGADEVLGGYDYFYAAYLKELLSKLFIISFLKNCYYLLQHKKLSKTLRFLLFYVAPISLQCYILKKRTKIINNDFYLLFKKDAESLLTKFYSFKNLKQFFINHFKYKFEHHLLWADKSGMYHSLETRFPFIDHNLIEKTLSTPDVTILNKGWTKMILRDSLKNILDDKIRLRKDKVGFETPEKKWFKDPIFKVFISDILNSETFINRPYFIKNKVVELFQKHINGQGDYSNTIWKAIHLELWMRKYIDCNNVTYVIITPVKNESEYIRYTLDSIVNQTILPKKWIIVDDGSTDNTMDIIKEYCEKHNWIELLTKDTKEEKRMGGSKVVKAFNYGYSKIDIDSYDFISKIDGDLSLPNNYFEKILCEFKTHPKLGICGGSIINKYSTNILKEEKSNKTHVRGALKTVRKECWKQINGFKELWNWDGLDIMEAQYHSWETYSIDIPVIHHRPTTSAYDPIEHAYNSGYESYKIGANYLITTGRVVKKLAHRPYIRISLAYLRGYYAAKKKKEKLIISQELASFINAIQYKKINIFRK